MSFANNIRFLRRQRNISQDVKYIETNCYHHSH
nr:MAG TPA: hypothetical protein [Caudoviricetes sp.]